MQADNKSEPAALGGWTLWFTGLSGSGKSTLARKLANCLADLGQPYELLDGDALRDGLCSDLGYNKEDRDENVRRISYVAQLLNRHNIVAIVAAISPYRQARLEARRRCSNFIEVHVDCPLDTLIERDARGLYRRALSGSLKNFTGISDPYEPPESPDVYINSGWQNEEQSFAELSSYLSRSGMLGSLKRTDLKKSV